MRALSDRRVAYLSIPKAARLTAEWQQAGLSSFAYRLAHLVVPRAALVAAVAFAFYLF